jgi:hypothetical protein
MLMGFICLSGCTIADEPPLTAPTVIAERGADQWDYVMLGSSFTWGVGPFLAEHLENDLGVKVEVHDYTVGSQDPFGLISALKVRPPVLEAVQEAEMITLCIGGKSPPPSTVEVCSGSGGGVNTDLIQGFRENYDALLDELALHADPSEKLVRVLTMYNPTYADWKAAGSYAACQPLWEDLNEQIVESATAHGYQVVDVYSLFNGEDHQEDPREKGWIGLDGEHTSEAGQAAIADLIRSAGYVYEPLKSDTR